MTPSATPRRRRGRRSGPVRPRLLFLGDSLPYPPDTGGALRTHHVLRTLAGHYEIDALFFHRRETRTQMPLDDRVEHLEELAEIEVFEVPGEWSGRRRLLDRSRSHLLKQPDMRWELDSRDFRDRVLELVFQRHPRLIHVDSPRLYGYLPLLSGQAVVLAHHHVVSRRLEQQAELSDGREAQRLQEEAQRVERVEKRWLTRVALNTVSSEADRQRVQELAPDAAVEVVPPGLDTRYFSPGTGTGQGLAFVGGVTGLANRDALDFFATDILPRLHRELGVKALEPISWVGPLAEGDRARYRSLGIDLTGHVEDIRPIVRPAACYIVPVRVGSGRLMEIIQAWAMGRAVVSTSRGCAGLAAVDGDNILIRDDPAGFADAIARVLRDRDLRARLGRSGRQTVERDHDWAQIGARMLERYHETEDAGSVRWVEQGVEPA